MAQYVFQTQGSLEDLRNHIHRSIIDSSISSSSEESYTSPNGTMSMDAFERYSYIGSNRVSLTVSIFQEGQSLTLVGMTTGGSQAVFLKINRFGESAFLNKLIDACNTFRPK